MAGIGQARLEFYWADHYGSYNEAKEGGGLRTVTHDHMDGEIAFNAGIVADIVDCVRMGATMVQGSAKIHFLLFDFHGKLVDVLGEPDTRLVG